MMIVKKRMNERKKGFTLIELSLSITFITVLSLAVALIITNSISAYHRGLVLNQINTIGMELVDDMRAAVQNAMVVSPEKSCGTWFAEGSDDADDCKNNSGQSLVAARKMTDVTIGEKNENEVPAVGVFCTGSYSYIWNSGYYYNEDAKVNENMKKATFKYKNVNGDALLEKIRLLKVKDEDRAVCVAFGKTSDRNEIDISGNEYNMVVTEDPIELLSENSNLALYDLFAPTPAINAVGNNIFYSVSFVLGTLQGGANVAAQASYCATPEGIDNASIENFDYCSINKFNFAAQAIGGGE